ncbi:MAG: hypothetical protein HS115_18240 [Spirochaetales bacterium]|nr:hypothetical protein [Spirochaetales bacterium]
MNLAGAVTAHYAVLQSPEEAVTEFFSRPSLRSWRIIRSYHLPLLLIMLFCSLVSPLRYLDAWTISPGRIVLPLVLALAWLLFAAVWDRVLEHRRIPPMRDADYTEKRNLILFLSLPVSGCALFFLLHPLVGYAVMGLAVLLTLKRGLQLAAREYVITLKQSIFYFLSTVALFQMIALVLLIVYNLFMTLRVAQFILDQAL